MSSLLPKVLKKVRKDKDTSKSLEKLDKQLKNVGGSNPVQVGNPSLVSEAVNFLSSLPDPNLKIVVRIDDQFYNKKKKIIN